MKFKESALAHKYCVGNGIEIGGASHNPFGLNTKNVDITNDNPTYQKAQIDLCGEVLKVDILSPGDNLSLDDESQDFVINSHVLEHFIDPIRAIIEWVRVIKQDGIVFMIIPHKERTFDNERPRTTLDELIERHKNPIDSTPDNDDHHSVWITEDVVELISYMNKKKMFGKKQKVEIVETQDVDDKVGNGFTIVLRKI